MTICSQQIIDAIETRLVGGTGAGTRVYSDRLWPLDEGKLPAIRIYEVKEEVTPITVHWPQLEQHVLEVAIELCGSAVSGIDATLAALKLQVLQRLFDTLAHATLGFTNVELQHVGTGPMQPIETATSQLAQRTLTVSARFSAYAQSPETFV